MSDNHEFLSHMLQNDADAQRMAVETAVEERTAWTAKNLTLEEQNDAFSRALGMRVSIAKPTGPAAPRTAPALEVYQAAELYGKQLERTRMIVPRMIPAGLTVLAGAPKRGKSWLALALAVAVASGSTFLGQQCSRGDVLYLDLESRQYRVQDRLSKLIVGPAPAGLYIAHKAEPLGPRLYDQLGSWVGSASMPSLIIIDTLGRVKNSGGRSENAYEADTRQYGGLQAWATEHRLAVVVVHHLRKVKDSDDWFDRINGSNGLVGAADAVLGLGGARGEQVSKLMVSGRDIDGDYNMAIRFTNGKWVLESADSEHYEEERAYVDSSLIQGIYVLMAERPEWQGSVPQLLDDIVNASQMPLDVVSAKDAARELQRFQSILYQREGILVGYRRTGQRRSLFIKNTRYSVQQVEMDEPQSEGGSPDGENV